MKKIIIFSLLVLTLITSCKAQNLDSYLEEVITLLEKNSIQAKEINWQVVRENLKTKYPNVTNDSIRYSIIKKILIENKLKHHSFKDPIQVDLWKNNKTIKKDHQYSKAHVHLKSPTSELIKGRIGKINVPMFATGDSEKLESYALELQKQIKRLSKKGVVDWIVDLRGNMGGNMWPMICGLGPLLEEGKLGTFTVPGDKTESSSWFYLKGKAFIEDNENPHATLIIKEPFVLEKINKIAVLLDKKTMSSGEATLVSFIGKKNVKTFGEKSGGFSTGNGKFDLSDGAALFITTSVFTDRTGKNYPNGILPDVLVTKEDTG